MPFEFLIFASILYHWFIPPFLLLICMWSLWVCVWISIRLNWLIIDTNFFALISSPALACSYFSPKLSKMIHGFFRRLFFSRLINQFLKTHSHPHSQTTGHCFHWFLSSSLYTLIDWLIDWSSKVMFDRAHFFLPFYLRSWPQKKSKSYEAYYYYLEKKN